MSRRDARARKVRFCRRAGRSAFSMMMEPSRYSQFLDDGYLVRPGQPGSVQSVHEFRLLTFRPRAALRLELCAPRRDLESFKPFSLIAVWPLNIRRITLRSRDSPDHASLLADRSRKSRRGSQRTPTYGEIASESQTRAAICKTVPTNF